MPTDRFSLGLAAAIGGPPAVRGELQEHRPAELSAELVGRALADAAAARAASAGRGPVGLVQALAATTGTAAHARAEQARRGPYPPPASPSQIREIVLLRAAGASLHVIAEKVGRPYTTVRDMVTRYEQRTGTLVTPARSVGADGRLQPARRPTIRSDSVTGMDRPNAWTLPDDLAALVHPDARPAVEMVLLDVLGPMLDGTLPDAADRPAVQRLADLFAGEGLIVEHGRIRRG